MAKHKKVFFSLEDRIVLDAAALSTSLDVVSDNDSQLFSSESKDQDASQSSNILENISNNTVSVLTNRVVIVDERADPKGEIQQYLRQKNVEVHVIAAAQNGVAAISGILDQYNVVDTLDIVSHGEEGVLELGNSELNNETLDQYLEELRSWSSHFSEDADILLYGCDVASGADGVYFIERVAEATQADIAASDDITGKSGDWSLEYLLGDVGATEIIAADAPEQGLENNSSGVDSDKPIIMSVEEFKNNGMEFEPTTIYADKYIKDSNSADEPGESSGVDENIISEQVFLDVDLSGGNGSDSDGNNGSGNDDDGLAPDLILSPSIEISAGADYVFSTDDPLFELNDLSNDEFYLVFFMLQGGDGNTISIDQSFLITSLLQFMKRMVLL